MNTASTSSTTATTKTVGTNAKTGQPMFQIALVQHSGLVLTWFTAEYTVTGSQNEIFAHYGITPAGLVETARTLLAA